MNRNAVAAACFFLSGFAGLVYEVCWVREASLIFGSTTFAVSTVLAVFFLGLAGGSYVFGRISATVAQPLRLYALLEVGLAVVALATLPALGWIEALYGTAYRSFDPDGPWLWAARLALVSLVLLPPTFLMGGTFPLFCQQYVRMRREVAGAVGRLYAVNTLGAAAGCAATGLFLLPRIGLEKSFWVGALLNLVAGGIVAWMRIPPAEKSFADSGEPPVASSTRAIVSALLLLTGFVALGHEVLWTRFLALLVRNTVHTYTITLAVVLVGIVLGSLAASRLFDRRLPRAAWFGALQVVLGLAVMALLTLPPSVWQRVGTGPAVYFALFLPAAVLAGASFPLAMRMVVEDPRLAGVGVGTLAAMNTLGGIFGSLLIGFLALPVLGLETSARVTTGLSLGAGFLAWLFLGGTGSLALRGLAITASLLLWVWLPRATGTRLPDSYLANDAELVEVREGLLSNLAVVRREGVLQLEIDRWWQGQDRPTHQIVAAHLPMLLHADPRRVLVVGVGAGQTPGRFLLYETERLDCVDIEPAVFDLIRSRFESAWMDDPRVTLIREDGRNYLTHTAARYDVISLELGQTFRPGVASFYTLDFYRRVRTRLEPRGLLSQFVPLPFLTSETFQGVVRTFLDVFPRSVLWYNTSELVLIGVNADEIELAADRLELLSGNPAIHDDLRYSHWDGASYWLNQPEVLMGSYLMGSHGLAALSVGGAIYRDDRPVLDYLVAGAPERSGTELEIVSLLRPHLEPLGAIAPSVPPASSQSIARIRERNLGDIAARYHLRQVAAARAAGGHEAVAALLAQALEANSESAEAHRVLADALLHLGQVAEAEIHALRAFSMRPDDAPVRRALGFALHRLGRLAEAIPHYRFALESGLEDPEVHNNWGAALGNLGDLEGAARHFEQALRMRPGFLEARENLERVRAAKR